MGLPKNDADVIAELQAGIKILKEQRYALKAENERLKGALEEINRPCEECPALGENCKEDGGNISACYRQKMIAKQALKGG